MPSAPRPPQDDLTPRLELAVDFPSTPFGVAVSGGPDSLALLVLADRARPGLVRAATVDHGLRPDSAAEAAQVAAVCAARAIPHAILRAIWSPPAGIGLQAQARAHRYALLDAWCRAEGLAALLTAHHRDDQAETLVMRLARGAGVGGLAGIRADRPLLPSSPVRLLRPLLHVAKADLVAVVAAAGLVAAEDPSNRDPRHDRTRVRALLAANPLLDPARLAASAHHLAEAEAALAWVTDREAADRIVIAADGAVVLTAGDLPDALLRRLVLRCLTTDTAAAPPRGPDLNRLILNVKSGKAATLGTILVRPGPAGWTFRPAPARHRPPNSN